ncbi:Gliding motility-associated ABC transporter permease protein GldF [hydrothermal vent metagenome]|uniref:Gliding motility-associated ABC transporter permease protein GldF n=1 Tax=hydrothermal vent metagenome TaxID=652676 RepID=A0A3B1CSR6_9ZZZZ
MSGTFVVLKRELKSYFYSPIAYAIIVMFLVISGYFFYSGMAFFSVASFEMSRTVGFTGPQDLEIADFVLRPFFGNIGVILLLMAPLITMRLFSEEKKTGSIELLFTWPLRDGELVIGKYLAALIVLIALLVPTMSYLIVIDIYTAVPWGVLIAGYLGVFLLGSAFIALGLFVSTLTENQIISSAITFGCLLIFWVIAWTAAHNTDTFSQVLRYLSILRHQDDFAKGVIKLSDVVYYLSFIFFFIFLSLRSLESKKWRG